MDVAAVSSAASRLIEAFEKMNAPRGEGLTGAGPSPVPDDLARQFENLLTQGTEAPQVTSVQQKDNVSFVSTAAPEAGNPAYAQNTLSITDFFSLQFKVSMVRFTMEAGSQMQQKTAQGFESLLKNQS